MRISIKIFKWAIFQFTFMLPDEEDDLDFDYFDIGIYPIFFGIQRYMGRTSLFFQICFKSDGEAILDYEKILKESK